MPFVVQLVPQPVRSVVRNQKTDRPFKSVIVTISRCIAEESMITPEYELLAKLPRPATSAVRTNLKVVEENEA
jgi:hypothetical protein